jgi:hypothetical protein
MDVVRPTGSRNAHVPIGHKIKAAIGQDARKTVREYV